MVFEDGSVLLAPVGVGVLWARAVATSRIRNSTKFRSIAALLEGAHVDATSEGCCCRRILVVRDQIFSEFRYSESRTARLLLFGTSRDTSWTPVTDCRTLLPGFPQDHRRIVDIVALYTLGELSQMIQVDAGLSLH